MGTINTRIHKYTDGYLSVLLVLLIDMVMSLMATAGTLLTARIGFAIAVSVNLSYKWLLLSFICSIICFRVFKTYQIIIRHSTLLDIWRLAVCSIGKVVLMFIATLAITSFTTTIGDKIYILLLMDAVFTFCLLVVVRVMMVVVYDFIKRRIISDKDCNKVLIYGIKDKSVSLVTRLQNSPNYKVVGFVEHSKQNKNYKISELPVYCFNNAEDLSKLKNIYAVLFATNSDAQKEQERLIKYALQHGVKILFAPPIDETVDGKLPAQPVREIRIEDLLGRKEIEVSMNEIIGNFKGKTVLITGAAGSIGSELCHQLATFGVKHLILFDNAETPMHLLRLELETQFPELDFVPVIGDVRIPARLDYIFGAYRPDVVFHAAAYKHVPLMEENPCEAVFVNVVGTRNVADKCLEYNVEKMIMISTDKAVNPTNIMGCTKRLAEIYVQSLGLSIAHGEVKGQTKFITTRFGNVLGSNGSVIPQFRKQIAAGGPITVTHHDIIRFFMTIPEACRLVMEAATISTGNQIMVFDMGEPVKIDYLAHRMIELAGLVPDKDIKIIYTGLRLGEKLYEEVLSDAENTLPTSHNRIRIATVREYDYAKACTVVGQLEVLSRNVNITEMVKLMKETVPEFISNNSEFEKLDKKTA